MKSKLHVLTLGFAVLSMLASTVPASAQLSKKPYSFPDRSGGSGMSLAARQAIVLNEINGDFRPEFLLRSPNGGLLTVLPNPSGSDVPVVFSPDGQLLPSFRPRRSSVRDGREFGAGDFNRFFRPRASDNDSVALFRLSNDAISVWTSRFVSGRRLHGGAVNEWTEMVYYLAPRRD